MLRLHRVVLMTGVCLATTMSMVAEPVLAAPKASGARHSTYTVVAGDYLSGIAVKLNVSMKQLLTANHLTIDSVILPGQQLVAPTTGTASTKAKSAPATDTSAADTQYTVASGDYLTGIADRLGVSIRALLTANQLSLNSLIFPGMKLIVPAGGKLPTATRTPKAPSKAPAKAPAAAKPATYTVESGDSLSGIAQSFGVSLTSLLATNRLSSSSLIYPGMALTLPKGAKQPAAAPLAAPKPTASKPTPKYTVVAGDYLGGIAQKLGVSLPSLLAANSLSVSSTITPGMALVVPAGGHLPEATVSTAGDASLSKDVRTVLAFARAQIGKPYKFNTAGPNTFDCSGLVLAAYAEIGTDLPHYSGAQIAFGTVVDWTTEAIRPGDLVFLESAPGSGVVNHVGIATSATTWVQAPRTGDVVREGRLSTTRIVGVRRLIGA